MFGAQSQQQQQQQQPAQETNKPFNFSAGMTPNFNFGGVGNAVEPQQVIYCSLLKLEDWDRVDGG